MASSSSDETFRCTEDCEKVSSGGSRNYEEIATEGVKSDSTAFRTPFETEISRSRDVSPLERQCTPMGRGMVATNAERPCTEKKGKRREGRQGQERRCHQTLRFYIYCCIVLTGWIYGGSSLHEGVPQLREGIGGRGAGKISKVHAERQDDGHQKSTEEAQQAEKRGAEDREQASSTREGRRAVDVMDGEDARGNPSRKRHMANQERLQKELEVLLEEQKNLAKDEDAEMEAKSEQQETEESLEALLREEVPAPSTAPSTGDFNKALGEMQAKLEIEYGKRLEEERQRMRSEMMSLLNAQNKQQHKQEDVVEVSDNEGTAEATEVKGVPGIGLLSSALPATPFGMQRLRHNNGSSPYGTGKKGEKESPNDKKEDVKNLTMEDVLKARMEEKPPDTGQP